MSPQEHAPSTPPKVAPPPFHPLEFHPEFGYLAPTLRFRRKAALIGKGLLFGAIVGAVAMIVLSPHRDVQVRSVFDIQTRAAAGEDPAPVRYIAATAALSTAHAPAVEPSFSTEAAAEPAPAVAVTPDAAPPAPAVSVPKVRKTAASKPKQKVARQPTRQRNVRPAEPDPRIAHADPFRRPTDLQPQWNNRGPFAFGW